MIKYFSPEDGHLDIDRRGKVLIKWFGVSG